MSRSSQFAYELFIRTASMDPGFISLFSELLGEKKVWSFNTSMPDGSQSQLLWSALGAQRLAIREYYVQGVPHRDRMPFNFPFQVILTVDVWGNRPCVHLAAYYENEGFEPVSFTAILDYEQLPSDLSVDRLFSHWLSGFFDGVGVAPDIFEQVLESCNPLGVDSITIIAQRKDERFDIGQIDVTVSSLAPDEYSINVLPMFPSVTNYAVSFVTSTPGPIGDGDKECSLSGSFPIGSTWFDLSSNYPYAIVEVNMVRSPNGRRAFKSDPLSILYIAQLFNEPGGAAFEGLTWLLTDITMQYDGADGGFYLDATLHEPRRVGQQLIVLDAAIHVTGRFVNRVGLVFVSFSVEGEIMIPQTFERAWAEAEIEYASNVNQWRHSLKIQRESAPDLGLANVSMFHLLSQIGPIVEKPTPVYWDSKNVIQRSQHRGGDYHLWKGPFG
ncbi:MAG: hypothetical protein OCC49_13500 [Fibrobacterales bacterium]